MKPLRVAILDEELPFPATSGKRIRSFNLLKRLAERHRVTYLCHRNPDRAESAEAADAFRSLGIETIVVDRAVPSKSGPGFYARLAGNLLSPLPYSVASHSSPALAEAARRFAARHRVDVWHCEWTPYAQVLREAFASRLHSIRWSVMAHNVESLIWRRYVETESNAMKRWYVKKQLAKFETFEKWAYSSASVAIAVSPNDAALMAERFGVAEASVVENGVDTQHFRPQRDVDRDPSRILFLGSLDWRPNLDAVHLLLDEIFPAVRRQAPEATLAIVGRHPPDWLKQQARSLPGVELHANVPDVRPYLATCGMLAVPLRIGGGSRLKILEALSSGTPVVSTRIGAEGLELKPGHDFAMVEQVSEMAEAIVRGIRQPYEMEDMAECGRRVVLQNYDWGPLAEKLDEAWWTVATAAAPAAA